MDQPGEEYIERKIRYDEIIHLQLLTATKSKTRQCIVLLSAIAVWFYFEKQDIMSAMMNGVVPAEYIALALYAIRKPDKAILPVLVIFTGWFALLMVVAAFIDPITLLKGIVVKVLIVVAIIKGVMAGKDRIALQKKLVEIQSEKNNNLSN